MNEKYDEKLWGQIEVLHQKSKRQQTSFNYVMEMLRSLQEAFQDFSKIIQNILNKYHQIIEYHSISMYDSADKFFKSFESLAKEFKEGYNDIKKQLIDPIMKPTNEWFTKENELYKAYVKCRTTYNNNKLSIEKYKQNYENSMKLCENYIINSQQMQILPYASADEKRKIEKKSNDQIKSSRNVEEKYINIIDNTNKSRDIEIQKQQELLQYYQRLDITFYEKLKSVFGLYIALMNKVFKNVLTTVDFLGKSYEQITVEKDIIDYISKNKQEKRLQSIVKFVPYIPSSDPSNKNDDPSKLDIYYEVLKTLKNNFKEIRTDINMEEETKRKRLRYLCDRIFKFGNNVSFSSEEKNELMSFLEIPSFKNYFIIVLSKQRTKGRFKRAESLVRDLSDLLLKILEIAEKEKDYESAKNCIILSQTYYFEEKCDPKKKETDNKNEDTKKVYLFELIKCNKWLTNLEFWDGLVDIMVENEIKKNEEVSKKQGIKDTEKTRKNRASNICFSQLLTYSSNMMEFGMNKEDSKKLINKYAEKYSLSQELAETIYGNVDIKQQEIDRATTKVNKNEEKVQKEENNEVKEEKKEEKVEINENGEKKDEKDNNNNNEVKEKSEEIVENKENNISNEDKNEDNKDNNEINDLKEKEVQITEEKEQKEEEKDEKKEPENIEEDKNENKDATNKPEEESLKNEVNENKDETNKPEEESLKIEVNKEEKEKENEEKKDTNEEKEKKEDTEENKNKDEGEKKNETELTEEKKIEEQKNE